MPSRMAHGQSRPRFRSPTAFSWSPPRPTAAPARFARRSSIPTPPPADEHHRLRHPGTGVQTIAPASPLPAITNPVLIDGTTQPGYAGAPLIAIVGQGTGDAEPVDRGLGRHGQGPGDRRLQFLERQLLDQLTIESVPLPQAPGGIGHLSNRCGRGRGLGGDGPGYGRHHVAVVARRPGPRRHAERRPVGGGTHRRDRIPTSGPARIRSRFMTSAATGHSR